MGGRLPQRVRSWLSVVALSAMGFATPSVSQASVSIAVTSDGLVGQSTTAAIALPTESRAVWENGRIYTYTHIRVDRVLAGELATGTDAWVRTLGGVVGKIGQIVEGEAVLTPGEASLLFLHPGAAGTFEVTARGQGQFPVSASGGSSPARITKRENLGLLFHPRGGAAAPPVLAGEWLSGRTVDDAAREVASAWSRMHAR